MRRRLGAIAMLAAGLCAQPVVARAQEGAWLQGEAGSLSLSTDAQAPEGRARLGGSLAYVARPVPAVTTRLNLDLRTGDAADGVLWPGAAVDATRPWSDLGLGLKADWTPASNAGVSLGLTDRQFDRPITPATLGAEADAPRDTRSEQAAALTASLRPAPQLALTLGGEVRSASDAMDLAADSGGRALLKTRDGAVNAGVTWTVTPRLKLQAGGKLTSTEVAWVEGASAAQDFAAAQPSVGATLTPWVAGAVTVDLARAVTPLDAGKFVALARVSGGAAAAELRPDQEWRVQARYTQALPAAARLEVGVLEAQVQSSTELVRVAGGAEAPGSVAGGRRSEVDVAFQTPLALLGVRSVALQTRGVWRDSQITDPLTGQARRMSGETPYETNLALVHTLGKQGLTWGVSTRDQGGQSFYGVNQLSSVETERSLGAFVEYKPSTFAVRLQLDDLAGGDRRWTDAYYVDGRDTGAIQRIDRRQEGGPGFSFSLKRAL